MTQSLREHVAELEARLAAFQRNEIEVKRAEDGFEGLIIADSSMPAAGLNQLRVAKSSPVKAALDRKYLKRQVKTKSPMLGLQHHGVVGDQAVDQLFKGSVKESEFKGGYSVIYTDVETHVSGPIGGINATPGHQPSALEPEVHL